MKSFECPFLKSNTHSYDDVIDEDIYMDAQEDMEDYRDDEMLENFQDAIDGEKFPIP